MKRISFQIFDRTFAITNALNTLTLLVAAIALLAALMAVHQSRLVDYGHWRAIGMQWSGVVLRAWTAVAAHDAVHFAVGDTARLRAVLASHSSTQCDRVRLDHAFGLELAPVLNLRYLQH